MQQQKDSALELTCVACTTAFSEQLSPFVACRNAHLSCEHCLLKQAQGYEYASFLCPECHAPTCKAAAVKCDWLPSFLSLANKRMQKASEENKLLLQENAALKKRLLCMDFKVIKTRSKLEKLEKWRNNFLVNCQRALQGTVSRKLLDGRFTEKDMQNSQSCFDSLLAEIRRLVEESKGREKTIDRLKTENALIAQRFEAIRSGKESVELNWSGTYAKPSTASKSRNGNCSRESLGSATVDKQRVVREDNFLTPSLAEVLRQRLRGGQGSEKKSEGNSKTYKKYLNMKIEGLDEKILDANPKFNRLNSNLKKLRDVFDSSTAKKGRPIDID